jgi:hypothetical protein
MPNPAEREVMALMLRTNAELVASVLQGADAVEGGSVMAAVAATRGLGVIVEDTLHALVQQARAEGHTWAEIGDLLRVTRQAAFARFGTPGDLAALDVADIPPLEGAGDRARQMSSDFLAGRFEEVREGFSERLRERQPVEVMKNGRARLEQRHGAFLEAGTPAIIVRHGLTFVDVPLALERGDVRNRVIFDVDGQVVAFGILPATEPEQP